MFPRKFLTASQIAFHAFNSSFFMVEINTGSFSNSRIWGPSKIPALIFSYVSLGNYVQRYWKHFPSLSKALTNCFINPGFMCNGGKSTFSLFTMKLFLCSFFQVQTFLYLAIFSSSSGLVLLCYPTSTRSKGISFCHLVAQGAFITPSSLHILPIHVRYI